MKLHPILFWVLVLFSGCVIWGWFSSRLILNAPRLQDYITPANLRLPSEDINFLSGKRKIIGWFVYSQVKNNQKTIIICHGWGASKGDVLLSTVFLREKFNLLYFDFTNHGESGGSKTSMGKYEAEDISAAVDFLLQRKPELSKSIGVLGFSMGGSAAIYAASKNKNIKAVIAESPFESFNRSVSHYSKLFFKIPHFPLVPITLLAVRFRLGFDPEKYSPAYHIHKISPTPVLLIASSGDKNIPLDTVQKLFANAREPKQLVVFDSYGHITAYQEYPQEYKKVISDFFVQNLINVE